MSRNYVPSDVPTSMFGLPYPRSDMARRCPGLLCRGAGHTDTPCLAQHRSRDLPGVPDVSVQRAFQPTGLGQTFPETTVLMGGSGTTCP